jgi:steroid 5-alpha reductase family enzyme
MTYYSVRNLLGISLSSMVLCLFLWPDLLQRYSFVSGQPPRWQRPDPSFGKRRRFSPPWCLLLDRVGFRVAAIPSRLENSPGNAPNAMTTCHFYSPIGGARENNTSIMMIGNNNNTMDISTTNDILLQNPPPAAFCSTTKPTDPRRLFTALLDRWKHDAVQRASSSSRPERRYMAGGSTLLIRALGPVVMAVLGTKGCHPWLVFPTLYFWALVGSSVGFHVYLYFISIGHAMGIFLPVLVTLIRYLQQVQARSLSISPSAVFHSVLVLLWSIRLCSFLLWREYIAWPALHAKIRRVQVDLPQKFTCWFLYSVLSVGMMTPCWWRLQWDIVQQLTGTVLGWFPRAASLLGMLLQITGLLLESVADYQKSAFKSRNHPPGTWCRAGLWNYSTHPNYAGEWLFWCGTVVAVLPTFFLRNAHISLPARFLPGLLILTGFYVLTVILQGSAQKLDQKHRIKYGSRGPDSEFLDFTRTTGIFGPRRYHVLPWRRPHGDASQEDQERNRRIEMAPSTEDVLDSTLAATEEIYR